MRHTKPGSSVRAARALRDCQEDEDQDEGNSSPYDRRGLRRGQTDGSQNADEATHQHDKNNSVH